jgi:hypothetical protein
VVILSKHFVGFLKIIDLQLKSVGFAVLFAAITSAVVSLGQVPSESLVDFVRQTVHNEIRSNNGDAKFMFKDQKETPHGFQTKLIAETAAGTAGLLVAIDGKPLTSAQREAEAERLDRLAGNPAELKKKQRAEREDAERTTRIMIALPDAFLYQRDGTEIGTEGLGKPGDELVRLTFRPNPKYDPPSRIELVLTGMRGYILIDANRHRIAKIDGTLFKEVGFGWGILGHLDKGGRFVVQQGAVGDGEWEITRMDLSFTGKELFFKKLVIKSKESFSDFRPAPANLTFAQAVELLKKEEAELAENDQQNHPDDHHRQ